MDEIDSVQTRIREEQEKNKKQAELERASVLDILKQIQKEREELRKQDIEHRKLLTEFQKEREVQLKEAKEHLELIKAERAELQKERIEYKAWAKDARESCPFTHKDDLADFITVHNHFGSTPPPKESKS